MRRASAGCAGGGISGLRALPLQGLAHKYLAPCGIGIAFRVPSGDTRALGVERGRDFGDLSSVARGDRPHTPLVRAVVVLADKHAHLLSLNVTESTVALKAIEFAQAAFPRGIERAVRGVGARTAPVVGRLLGGEDFLQRDTKDGRNCPGEFEV